ncbi:MAG: HAD family hydrolase [Acidobacteria bacterium]|nr:MAG: HAD family hydrolase [Acidobacteriota bacterium]
MRGHYQAISFDLFDTLVDLDEEKLPLVKLDGEERRSTGEVIYGVLRQYYPEIGLDEFLRTLFRVAYREVDEWRRATQREVLAEERFRRVLQRLGIASPSRAAVHALVTAHMDRMFAAMECPEGRLRILDALVVQYPLALVSNFDHPPTARRVLDHFGLAPYFRAVIISGEIGWRKPAPQCFLMAVEALGVRPQACLHVGDSLEADVVGAKRAGLDAAWLRRTSQSLWEGMPAPDYTIEALSELLPLLGIRRQG